jgi:alpha-galactosidase
MEASGTHMKIVTIGAGSVAWGPTINTDFLLNPDLDGAELMLMDISSDNLGRVTRLLERFVRERGFRKTITATTDVREALVDADYVITAISVGGDRLWRYDSMFPQIYSVYQPVGDTIGPGGLVRALRHAGPLLQIARIMREVSKPGATLIQLTNPMNPLCSALEQLGGVKVIGICHGIDDTRKFVAECLGENVDDVHIDAAGNNHLIWCDEIVVGDEVYSQDRIAELAPRLFDTPFRKAAWERYGGLVGNHSRHPIEFLPGFLTQEHGFGTDWGVPPLAIQIDPMRGDRHDAAFERLERALTQEEPIQWRTEHQQGGLKVNDAGLVETGHSREGLDDLIAALDTGQAIDLHINVANDGAIAGVDPAYNVELPTRLENGEIHRKSIAFNDRITGEINRVGQEQHLIGQACLDYDEDVLIEALSLDALVPDRDLAARLVREMVAFERDYLKEYYPV